MDVGFAHNRARCPRVLYFIQPYFSPTTLLYVDREYQRLRDKVNLTTYSVPD